MALEEEEEEEGKDSFRLLFVTLSMILLAFFILLNSMATINTDKKRLALGSLLGSFGLMPGTESVEAEGEQVQSRGDDPTTGQGFAVFEKIQHIIREMNTGTTDEASPIYTTFDEKTGEIKVVAADELVFGSGKAAISPRMFRLLSEIGRLAKQFDGKVKVLGHADRTGREMDNWIVSLDRAAMVARNIEASASLSRGQICAVGHSYYHPLTIPMDANTTMSSRRVEILVIPPGEK